MHNIYLFGFSPTSWVIGRKERIWNHKPRSKTVYAFGPFRLVICRNVGEF